jgi:hypothetical protein
MSGTYVAKTIGDGNGGTIAGADFVQDLAGGFAPAAALPTAIVSASFSRPANTTVYANAQLVANSTTAGSVVPLSLANASRKGGVGGVITGARLSKSGGGANSNTNALFRVHIFEGTSSGAGPTPAVGDGGVYSTNVNTVAASEIGYVDIDMTSTSAVGSDGCKAYTRGLQMAFMPSNSGTGLYALIEVRGAYTPISGETFTLALEIAQD